MRIHLISDTHIEMGYTPDVTAVADVIVCAGDIGTLDTPRNCYRLKKFFLKLKKNCDHVIWVLGNHEFYNSDYNDVLGRANRLAQQVGIHLLDIEFTPSVEIDGVKFWGTTFWTDLGNKNWYIATEVRKGLNDYYVIKKDGKKLHTDDTFQFWKDSVAQIDWDADVVITHHSPVNIPHRRFQYNKLTHGFQSFDLHLKQAIEDSKIKYWLYGHTHDSRVKDYDRTIVCSNQHGYITWQGKEETGYDPKFIIEIDNV